MGTISRTKIHIKSLKSKKIPDFTKIADLCRVHQICTFMIQRIQSLFLAIAAAAAVLMLFFPVADFLSGTELGNYKLLATGLKCMDPNPRFLTSSWFGFPLTALISVNIILPILVLFLYRNRQLQIKILAFNILIAIVLIIVVLIYYISSVQKLTGIQPSYQFGAFCPLISLVFLVLANRFIRKDENLVRSADRLR